LALAATAVTAQEEYRPLRTGGLDAETAALLMSGQEGGSIPISALAVPGAAGVEAKAAVEFFVEVAGEALLAGHVEDRVRLEFCLYALAGSRVVDASLETVELLLAQDRERLMAGGVKSRSTLSLAAGDYVVRILVRNVQTRELGLRSFPLEVPAIDSGPSLQSLLVPDPAAGWLRLARDAGPPTTGFWPAARPVLASDRDADLQILVRGLEPDAARLELSGSDDSSIDVPAAVSPSGGSEATDFERWTVRARLPYLEPGDYELRLRVGDSAISPRLPIVVRQVGTGIWAGSPAASPVAEIAAESALPTVGDQRAARRDVEALAKRLKTDYRAALDRLAAADLAGAITALTRLEAAAFEQEGGASAVANAEMETARALARATDGSLVPLFDLHYRAYRRYLTSQSFRLSSHARDQLLDLVDLHLSRQPRDTSPATDILVVMANQLQQAGLARYSRVVFRRALQVDPSHQGALLGIAAGLEKHGEYHQACEFLEQLLDKKPGHREAKLRLAVNLTRSGNPGRGRSILSKLVESGEEDWILAVAYHELARDLIGRDRLVEAETRLIAARQRLPEDDQLDLLLAAVRDARQNGAGGERELAIRSRADRPSPRHHYQQWPRFTPGSGQESKERRLEALAAALQGLRGEA
jgi:tetratricopeptide (TPR) repeat protein